MSEQELLMQEYKIGTIKFIEKDRGFGFIRGEDGENDMFFHFTKSPDFHTISNGDTVQYKVEKSSKGKGFEGIGLITINGRNSD